ncbi:Major facilitator superfamily domain general substrate transporter [Penicillium viridicatum]|nr:Major facilitator superfamily domain general substrate transporter [Penicillium viridicatum]
MKVNQRGQVGYQTYLAFIAIQCLGLVIGPLLSNPEKVHRDGGTRIEAPRSIHWRQELREMWRLARSRSILLLVPLFWYLGGYPGTYLATYFTVRARALGSFMSAVVGTLATWLGGSLVDLGGHYSKRVPTHQPRVATLQVVRKFEVLEKRKRTLVGSNGVTEQDVVE